MRRDCYQKRKTFAGQNFFSLFNCELLLAVPLAKAEKLAFPAEKRLLKEIGDLRLRHFFQEDRD